MRSTGESVLRSASYLAQSLIVLGAFASCASASERAIEPEDMTVPDLIENFASLEGRTIGVRGWLSRCDSEHCGLYASRREARRGVITGWALVVEPDASFLASQSEREAREVVLTARVVVDCRSRDDPENDGEFICLEQIGHLEPVGSARLLGR